MYFCFGLSLTLIHITVMYCTSPHMKPSLSPASVAPPQGPGPAPGARPRLLGAAADVQHRTNVLVDNEEFFSMLI